MTSFLIKPCTVTDGPSIGRNNVHAFWTDKTWIQVWLGLTRDFVAEQAAKRGARNLLLDRAHRRHLQAVDATTGAVVGYARWVLPRDDGCSGGDGDPCHAAWTEARVPDVAAEVRQEADRECASSVWDVDANPAIDGIDAPIVALQEKLLSGKRYMGMLPIFDVTNM
jgi:hypothetical protein